ncbi:MAG: hypothetical protein Q4G35_09570 [Propionibacteriaceae bacterium]|nr:hypothetical protein [Propionibacteriaceae bacterium]
MRRILIGLTATAALTLTGCIGTISGQEFDALLLERHGGMTEETLTRALTAAAEDAGYDDWRTMRIRHLNLTGPQSVTVDVTHPTDPNQHSWHSWTARHESPSVQQDSPGATFDANDIPAVITLSRGMIAAMAEGLPDEMTDFRLSVMPAGNGAEVRGRASSQRSSVEATFDPVTGAMKREG